MPKVWGKVGHPFFFGYYHNKLSTDFLKLCLNLILWYFIFQIISHFKHSAFRKQEIMNIRLSVFSQLMTFVDLWVLLWNFFVFCLLSHISHIICVYWWENMNSIINISKTSICVAVCHSNWGFFTVWVTYIQLAHFPLLREISDLKKT